MANLPDNYFTNVAKPYVVDEVDLDAMVNGVNANKLAIENTSTGHDHNGVNSKKILQVAHIHLSKVCLGGGAENKIKFHVGMLDPTVAIGDVTILGGITRKVGYSGTTGDSGVLVSDAAATGISIGDHVITVDAWEPAADLTSSVQGAHSHTLTMNPHAHSFTGSAHTHDLWIDGGALGDPAVYCDPGSEVLRKVGSATTLTSTIVAASPGGTVNANTSTGSISSESAHSHTITKAQLNHIHTASASAHSITDPTHTHNIATHTHTISEAYVGDDAQTPSISLDGSYSVPWNITIPQTADKSKFTQGAHEMVITVTDSCEIQLSIWVKGTIV